MSDFSYAVQLAQKLIRCPSITPEEAGTLDLLEEELTQHGFNCTRLAFGDGKDRIDNLYAEFGEGPAHFAFAGHVDVVPVGRVEDWQFNPFQAEISDGFLYGRGAADMKSGIAAFISAIRQWQESSKKQTKISLIITGDEEADAINGTSKMVDWMRQNNIRPDMCIVAEPTSQKQIGDNIRNGRRGSLSGSLIVTGKQGHVAYPHLTINPIPTLVDIINSLQSRHLDNGSEFFQPSNLEITTVDVGNPTENMIPEKAGARFNIRFNVEHDSSTLVKWIEGIISDARLDFEGSIDLNVRVSGESFLTPPCKLTDIIQSSAKKILGVVPDLSTSGGTSDARFITHYAPVAEFGLVGATMHQVNEQVNVEDILSLTKIYKEVLQSYFN